jgi:putative redox protein
MVARSVVVNTTVSSYAQEVSVGPHLLRADEPHDFGGDDLGPNPYELLLAALGACTNMTLRMYAERKRWPLEGVQVRLTHSRIYAEDCATCDTKEGMLDRIDREILVVGNLSDEQRQRLMEIADRCPIHRTLVSEIQISTRLAMPGASTNRESQLT